MKTDNTVVKSTVTASTCQRKSLQRTGEAGSAKVKDRGKFESYPMLEMPLASTLGNLFAVGDIGVSMGV